MLSPQGETQLGDAQQAWAAMRDADCALVRGASAADAGSLKPELAQARCMAEHTLNRAAYVEGSLRKTTHSTLETQRIRTLRSEAIAHREEQAAAVASGAPKAQECRYESAIGTPPPTRTVALTFDDGPEEGETEYVLDALARHHVRAAFVLMHEIHRHTLHKLDEVIGRLESLGFAFGSIDEPAFEASLR
ncbi:MAG: DUF1311 domain-containing protein [Pseudomonadota bacterium]|nr:DUF1311 domain-containing protein [Pseudomonadota bacterium]